MNLHFNWIIIIELYDVGNIAGLGFEKGNPDEKTLPQIIKFRKQRFRFEHVIFKRFHIKYLYSLVQYQHRKHTISTILDREHS
jgi:hypothetical protein